MTSATPARFEHAVHLVERLERAREILKRCAADDEIELVGGEGQVGGVVLEVDTDARFARIFVGDAHEGVAGIEPDDAAASERGDFDGEIAGPGRDFEHAGPRTDVGAIRRAVALNSAMSWAVCRAYQAAMKPSIPTPFWAFLGASVLGALPSWLHVRRTRRKRNGRIH